jgi:hypothetical protein
MPSKNKSDRQAGGSNGQPAKRLVSLMGIRIGPLPPPASFFGGAILRKLERQEKDKPVKNLNKF